MATRMKFNIEKKTENGGIRVQTEKKTPGNIISNKNGAKNADIACNTATIMAILIVIVHGK